MGRQLGAAAAAEQHYGAVDGRAPDLLHAARLGPAI